MALRRSIAAISAVTCAVLLGFHSGSVSLALLAAAFTAGVVFSFGIFFVLEHVNTLLIKDAAAIANNGSDKPTVEEYYNTLESRLGYWLLLGNARHCGLWRPGTI